MKTIKNWVSLGMVAGWLFSNFSLLSPGIVHAAPVASAEAQVKAPININKAGLEELQNIRGVGPMTAERIISYRQEAGSFKTIEDLANVKGIGSAKLEKIKSQVIV